MPKRGDGIDPELNYSASMPRWGDGSDPEFV